MSFNYIDLFAGAGGLSEGFKAQGFNPVAHVEIDTAACFTLKTRAAYHHLKENNSFSTYCEYLRGEISRQTLYGFLPNEVSTSIINKGIGPENNLDIFKQIDNQISNLKRKEIDLIVGGPPCQAYSLVGRARSEDNMKGDSRNFLYVQYAAFLERYQPKMFVFENVIGLLSAGKGIYLENMRKLFSKKGYEIEIFRVNAENFGVLQKRRRLIIVGWKKDLVPLLPNLESLTSNMFAFVNDVFNDLSRLKAGEGSERFINYSSRPSTYLTEARIRNGLDFVTQHIARPHSDQDKEIYKYAVDKWETKMERLNYNDLPEKLKTHVNRTSFTDRFKVVAHNLRSSHTVVAHIAKDGHYYIHNDFEQNRSISVREAARLQSFPDDYFFEGVKEGMNRTAAFKQIGNAVPPLMARKIAAAIHNIL
ncbi:MULTISPECIES: DNA cytosine methyltransferase [unclassified Flavobacterium]|uniref:DNA cytosine methyltransferase n=1 Tax=unclassified Flavobacterium TaxID=196869 RepID=UPI001F138B20|nr:MULTISPECIES: DNA cytosine methyltransferase [unclassified Flavobacterium]UMY66449.1 DNA cytosine methyltransferase [Flavobacterium sp. HJ-32-4]